MRTRPCLLAVLAATGCSLVVDPKKIDPNIPPDVATFCLRAEDILVRRLSECGAATPELVRSQLYLPCQAEWQHAIDRSNSAFDKYAAADCLAAADAEPCPLLVPPNGAVPEVCTQVMGGSLADAVACEVDAECGSGLCLATATCPGVCAEYSVQGQTCSGRRNVGPRCHKTLVCNAGTCQDIVYQGQDCTGRPLGCEPGAYCEGATNLCQWQKGEGGACASQDECDPGLLCAVVGFTPLRQQCLKPRPPGASCTVGQRDCTRGTYCKSAAQLPGDVGTCVAWPQSGACDAVGLVEPYGCLGRWCNTGTCTDFTPEASPCTSPLECAPGATCNTFATPAVCFTSCMP
jgi:hypothetical protein